MTDGKALLKSDLWEDYATNLYAAYNAMRRAFKRSGLSQDEVAQKLGIDKALASRRLKGRENLTLKTLSFMASALGCRLTIYFTPYAEVGAKDETTNNQFDAWANKPAGSSSHSTADEPAFVEPRRKAA